MTTDIDVFDALKYRVEVDEFGTRSYYNSNGKLHRVEGPAIVYPSGAQEWYQNGKLHRIGGPAIIWANGFLEWWQNGQRHREDGPAVVGPTGVKEWYLLDIKYTRQEYYRQLAILRNTK